MPGSKSFKYWISLTGMRLVGSLPSWFLYSFGLGAIHFILYRVLRYRLKVVRKNLAETFTDRTTEELRAIEKGFYRHLAEVMVDTIDMINISEKEVTSRMTFLNDPGSGQSQGRNWIGALAHFGAWEYFSSFPLWTPYEVAAVYRPLHSKTADDIFKKLRSRFGTRPVAMHETLRYVAAKQSTDDKFVIGLIADQTPHRGGHPHWFNFLGRPTCFLLGIEKIALKYSMPVYFASLSKLGKRKYTTEFEIIWDGIEPVTEDEITRRYVKKLEAKVLAQPHLWMWSHRRWKHTPDDAAYKNCNP